jgi:hypothetical protein
MGYLRKNYDPEYYLMLENSVGDFWEMELGDDRDYKGKKKKLLEKFGISLVMKGNRYVSIDSVDCLTMHVSRAVRKIWRDELSRYLTKYRNKFDEESGRKKIVGEQKEFEFSYSPDVESLNYVRDSMGDRRAISSEVSRSKR